MRHGDLDSARRAITEKRMEQKIAFWTKMRDVVQHEDNLVNHRFNWLLAFEGLVMAGFVAIERELFNNYWKMSSEGIILGQLPPLLLMILALWTVWVSGQTISSAFRHIHTLDQVWRATYKEEENWKEVSVPRWLLHWDKDRIPPAETPERKEKNEKKVSFLRRLLHWKEDRVPLAESNPIEAEFPPLRGKFNYSRLSYTQRIPTILFIMNLAAAVFCLVIIGFALAGINLVKALS